MQTLPLGDLSATPWAISPLWFVFMALAIPGFVWLAFAWRRALLECPNRVRRAGVKEMRRLLKSLQRSNAAPEPAHLHAWLRVSARVWDVRTAAPCVSEVSQAAYTLTGDESVSLHWRELWQSTEHGLYAADGQTAADWLERASAAASSVGTPKRERMFPSRLIHWLPSLAVGLFVVTLVTSPATDADVPWSSPPTAASPASPPTEAQVEPSPETAYEPLPPEVQQAAQAALATNWNDWAAHHNLAAYQTQQGALNLAIAHATAAFAQHPAAEATRDTLLAAFGETETIDPNLRRLLSGAWYERAPTLLSAAAWQRLALIAGLIAAAGLSVMVITLYKPHRRLSWIGRGAFAAGTLLLIAAIPSWNAYGELNQPAAAILVENASMSPVPTDLVPAEETSPLAAGTVVVTHRTFLSWLEISNGPNASGWIRSNAVTPLYAR